MSTHASVAPAVELLNQFRQLLDQEFQALKSRQLLALNEYAQAKTDLLDQLTSLGMHIAPATDSAQYPDWRASVHPLLQECQRQNDINGKLIELNLVTSRKLSHLLAQARDRDSVTYNDHGLTRPSSSMPLGIKA